MMCTNVCAYVHAWYMCMYGILSVLCDGMCVYI